MKLSKDEFIGKYKDKFETLHGKSIEEGTMFDKYTALAALVKDQVAVDWVKTNNSYNQSKQVYYFSMEFLPGKFLDQNLSYRGLKETAQEALAELGIDLQELEEMECDAALGNGGLGRLGACFLDSMASLGIAGHGCCLRYKYGLFRQKIVDGFQVELPDNWLNNGNIWEIEKKDKAVEVRFGGTVRADIFYGRLVFIHENYEAVKAVPYDVPVVGYRNNIVNTLRLWRAEMINKDYDLSTYMRGDYLKVLEYKHNVESISQILYPDDSHEAGKLLRLKQQYFLVSSGLQSIVNRFKKKHGSLSELTKYVAIHINDTHPALCIPELMRILIDEEGMDWDDARRITSGVVSYTNHTILPEALEKWPVDMLKKLLPRIYLIIEEINERFCREVCGRFQGDWQRAHNMAIIKEGQVHMAHLANVGSCRVNGVSKVHSQLLQDHTMKQYHSFEPHKFSNKTNGVSHRRFLLGANPKLADLISETIGPDWVTHPNKLLDLKKYAGDPLFLQKLSDVKRENKVTLAEYIKQKNGLEISPDALFDVHVKRIHAYKRQLLNVLHIMDLYNKIRENPEAEIVPRVFIFAGKAAPGYLLAKKIIKLINTVAQLVNADKMINDKIKVVFLENYNVSLAELIIPAADVSEQISTASKEASGTGNMKFMMNGAITIGTRDGANIEICEEAGEDNIICFGLTVSEVLHYYQKGGYSAWEVYNNKEELKVVVDQLVNGFLPAGNEEFREIYNSILAENDEYFILKDFTGYADAQARINRLYKEKELWLKMCTQNIAHAGKFSSDRTIREYAHDIWRIDPSSEHNGKY